jgi:hypothetical protein
MGYLMVPFFPPVVNFNFLDEVRQAADTHSNPLPCMVAVRNAYIWALFMQYSIMLSTHLYVTAPKARNVAFAQLDTIEYLGLVNFTHTPSTNQFYFNAPISSFFCNFRIRAF